MPQDAEKAGREAGFLIAVIGDEDTVTGFLLAGVGQKDPRRENYFIVDSSKLMHTFTVRCAAIDCSRYCAECLRPSQQLTHDFQGDAQCGRVLRYSAVPRAVKTEETPLQAIEDAFVGFTQRDDIAIILINQFVRCTICFRISIRT